MASAAVIAEHVVRPSGPAVRPFVLRAADSVGLARDDSWAPGDPVTPPFVVRRDAKNYAGKLTEAEILAVFERGSCGRFGTSLDYLVKTVSSLREHGLCDPHLERLARHAGAQVLGPARPKMAS